MSAPGKDWPSYEVTAYYADNSIAHRATVKSVPNAEFALSFAALKRAVEAPALPPQLLVTCKRVEL